MLKLLIGTDWVRNSDLILESIAQNVKRKSEKSILIVPELISHDTERRLCEAAGNTASRFAEVLTFTRLASRVSEMVGNGMQPCLDNGGRVVAMASAVRQLHSKLKAYASVETKPEFLSSLVDAVDEFKRCCITSADLKLASGRTEGAFAQKLEELSLILEAYDGLCMQGKKDPRDQMTWLLEQLEDSDYISAFSIYIDGFPDFTRQHFDIVSHMIANALNVTISVNCDRLDDPAQVYEKAAATARQILLEAKRLGISCEVVTVQPGKNPLLPICDNLFQGNLGKVKIPPQRLHVYQADTAHMECVCAAEQITNLVRSGARYREIAVVCAELTEYKNLLGMVFNRYNIPFYTSGTEDILEKSVISTVLSALEAADGYSQEQMLRYIKSPLACLDDEESDRLENYALIWGVSADGWCSPWENHPEGLGGIWTDKVTEELARLNQIRLRIVQPLIDLRKALTQSKKMSEMVEGILVFLERIEMQRRLAELSAQMETAGDNRNGQILDQLWDILLSALEQLYDVLGQTAWDPDTFSRLLKLLLQQYDVGTIPASLDTVTVGAVSAMRCQRVKHLFVLGAEEGAFPHYGGVTGVFTDQERSELRQMGVPLTGGAFDGLQTEFLEIYEVFCGAQEKIWAFCSGEQPSYVFRRLSQMAGGTKLPEGIVGPAQSDRQEAAAYLLHNGQFTAARSLSLEREVDTLRQHKFHVLGKMERESVRLLYGDMLNLSASQVDQLAECRMAYFLKYGLKAKERKTAEIDPAQFGTYIHYVLENTARQVVQSGGFPNTSFETVLETALVFSDAYIAQNFSQLGSQRVGYLMQRNQRELELILRELWEELQQSEFQPVAFELAFGNGQEMPPIPVSGEDLQGQLRGFVDRVDVWKTGNEAYFRVVDYKTGRKDFDYCDVFNGIGLQMLLYLFALEQGGENLLGENAVAAGVQYFPARAPIVSADGVLSEEEIAKERQKLWKRKGLLLQEENVLTAMDPTEKAIRSCFGFSKNGELVGDLADRDQFRQLRRYIAHILRCMVDDIAAGNVEPNPYTRGTSHNACAYCPYGMICHPENLEQRRNYQAMKPQRFWEEIGKELDGRG